MHILLITGVYKPRVGTRAVQIERFVSALEKQGITTSIVGGSDKYPATEVTYHSSADNESHRVALPFRSCGRQSALHNTLQRITQRIDPRPDKVTWVTPATQAAARILGSMRINAIISASTPIESHVVGMRLSQAHRLPWFAFFSDPWPPSDLPLAYRRRTLPWITSDCRALVKDIVHTADHVVLTCREAVLGFHETVARHIETKCTAIPHVWGGNFTKTHKNNVHSKGWVIHVGDLTKERALPELIEALKEAKSRSQGLIRGLALFGRVSKEFQKLVKQRGAEALVDYRGEVPAEDVPNAVAGAVGLLLIESAMKSSPFLPSKFSEYASLPTPICAITPDTSATRRYLSAHGGGVAVNHSVDSIADGLMHLLTLDSKEVQRQKAAYELEFSEEAVGSRWKQLICGETKKRT